MKLFQAKEVKHVKKSTKFDLGLVYRNTKYTSDLLHMLAEANEYYK